MHLRNLVKKDRLANPPQTLDPPIFIRSDTSSQEVIHPPSFDQRRRSRSSSTASARTAPLNTAPSPHALRRLSQKLHISRLDSSHNVPSNLPEIVGPAEDAQWERRAALLVGGEERRHGLLATRQTDADIQQAIRLHEAGELQESTRIFERLADPRGANNALSQVLYGLALR
ncbi:hypothetical protein CDD81_3945 [Ophiocordyceps australis]|uniref:Uncharacterized protein n=1 Tax=Ophiocordyceps australis TaxID=1399860 RepID=A0A2C5X735_9HYPO|nr:hypothetical protein CDD81_3945 [Ophiocordyceps australis]